MGIPTESEIEAQAASIFPDNKELQASFIMGTWHTIYNLKTESDGDD